MNSMNEEQKDFRRCGRGRGRFWKIPFFILGAILIKSALVMLLWNFLIPDLFHGPTLDYPQAIGLMILAKMLVGFHGPRHWGGHRHGPWGGGHGRWGHLHPEEREKLREEFRKRCGDRFERKGE